MVKRNFTDKVVWITGAAGGLGRSLSRRFGRAGARLGLTDLDEPSVRALERELAGEGVDGFGFELDVSDEGACHRAAARIAERFGRLDVLINNAGVTHRSPFARTQGQVYRRVMAVNYFGSLYCTQAALPQLMRHEGLIIVISSVAGFAPLVGRTGYAASKHALHGLFETLRAELRGTGVDVSLVCPGFIATNIDRNALGGDGHAARHPQSRVGRVARPEDVAEAVFRAALRGKRLVVLSRVGKITWLLTRCLPSLYEGIMVRAFRSELDERPGEDSIG